MKSKQYWVEQLGERWTTELKDILRNPYMEKLENQLTMEYAMNTVYPNREDIFQYFRLCPYEKLKAVVIFKEPGVDINVFPKPYDDSYIDSLNNGSMNKIRQCVHQQYYTESNEIKFDFDYSFENWAKQGVLILPTSLTVKKNCSGEHIIYWKKFVKAVIENINTNLLGTVFILWGEEAQQFSELLSKKHHVFSWESPTTAFNENRDWCCPNFKQVDVLLTYLNGKENTIRW